MLLLSTTLVDIEAGPGIVIALDRTDNAEELRRSNCMQLQGRSGKLGSRASE